MKKNKPDISFKPDIFLVGMIISLFLAMAISIILSFLALFVLLFMPEHHPSWLVDNPVAQWGFGALMACALGFGIWLAGKFSRSLLIEHRLKE